MNACTARPSVTGRFLWSFAAVAGAMALGCGSDAAGVGQVGAAHGDVTIVRMDIKPGSCPNPIQCRSRGVLPVAITGAFDFDVHDIDPESVLLEGVPPVRWSYEDVATPFFPDDGVVDDCFEDCWTERGDGFTDLSLKFDNQAVVQSLEDQGVSLDFDACVALRITGDRTPEAGGGQFEAWDTVRSVCR
ncbi:MAG: hypothetical protein ACOC97_03260 [Myxococcota bacterium]